MPGKNRRLGGNNKPASPERVRQRFLRIWSDPLDLREECEIADELGVEASELVKLRMDPSFYEPAWKMFQQAFPASLIPLKKRLTKQAIVHGSVSASRLLLEVIGMIEGKNKTQINVNVGTGDAVAANLSDPELDSEIHRLLIEVGPADVSYRDGQAYPIIAIDAEVIDEPKQGGVSSVEVRNGRAQPKGKKGKALSLPPGASEASS